MIFLDTTLCHLFDINKTNEKLIHSHRQTYWLPRELASQHNSFK